MNSKEVFLIESDNDFEEKANKGWAVVDFFADWCGPCKQMAPLFQSLAKDPDLAWIAFYKANAQAVPQASLKYQIQFVPTFVILHEGEEKSRITGLKTAADFKKWIEANKGS